MCQVSAPADLPRTLPPVRTLLFNTKTLVLRAEAAAEAGPPTPTTAAVMGGVYPAGALSPDANRAAGGGGTSAAMSPPPTLTRIAISQPGGNGGTIGTGGTPSAVSAGAGATASTPISLVSPPAPLYGQMTPVASARTVVAPAVAASMVSAPSSSPSSLLPVRLAQSLPTIPTAASRPAGAPAAGSLSYGEVSMVSMSPALSAELLPPRGVRFDAPPMFDRRVFQEELDEEGLPVDGMPWSQ